MNSRFNISLLVFLVYLCLLTIPCFSQAVNTDKNIDENVKKFLESQKYSWRDMNVPETDGKILYDLIIKNKYTKALEIGTSSGHSAIWIAWALSKTGGKLITIEINERRYNQAVKNFQESGLSEFIDARLTDAHELVPKLQGPFDFIFIDADKNWYTNYAKSLVPKLEIGGCLTAHNVSERRGWRGRGMTGDFLDYMRSLQYMETSIARESRSGISVSYKKQDK